MRLWHQKLIWHLDGKRLLGQHRECCALRGRGWGKKHSVVDYVFRYGLAHLYEYHKLVMNEMIRRNYNVDDRWYDEAYRGRSLPPATMVEIGVYVPLVGPESHWASRFMIYPEHDDRYLKECLLNLKSKGAELNGEKNIESWLIELDLRGVG